MRNELLAKCNGCGHSLKVVVGRKSTCRQVTCTECGRRYDYSAWKLKKPHTEGPLSLATFYQVEFVEVMR